MRFYCFLIIFFILINLINNEKLKKLFIVFRHGDRAPSETYYNDPYRNYSWPNGWGQLTNIGKQQIYQLGQYYRNEYKHFIPEYYYHKNVQILSSYSDRCLMSAQVFLAGLFPPKNEQIWNNKLIWQPIPVHYTPRNKDNLIAMKAPCKKFNEELINSKSMQQANNDNEELLKLLSEYTGDKIDNIGALELLYNTLEIEKNNNLTLPDWVTDSLMIKMHYIASQHLAFLVDTTIMKRLKGGVFLRQIINIMNDLNDERLLFLYSGHDITLVNILRAMNVIDLLKPGFAASLVIEFYENNHIKLIYRDDYKSEPKEMVLPQCTSPCPLNKFQNLLKDVLPTNWYQECLN